MVEVSVSAFKICSHKHTHVYMYRQIETWAYLFCALHFLFMTAMEPQEKQKWHNTFYEIIP